MGIVASQSLKNMITTYLGFGIGAVNTLVLYVHFFKDENYGLVSFLLSTASILMPVLAFGVHSTIVKFYTAYAKKDQDSFLTLMLVLPVLVILPATAILYFFFDKIDQFLTSENEIVGPYIWLIFFIGVAMAYFEIFYAWARIQLQSVLGNFMKEVFHRLAVTFLLLAFAINWLDFETFLAGLGISYVLRTVVMMFYAFKLKRPKIVFTLPKDLSRIIKYSALIIIAGSVAVMILEIDMFMIGKMVPIENVAFYAVAIYIATVIAVPSRAMHQITYPLTAKLLNAKDHIALEDLYKKSSLTLFIVSGLIFLLILCNIKQLYLMLDPNYAKGLYVVLLISLAKLLDNIMGNNNAIIYNSDYYRLVLVLGVGMVILAVALNTIFIPWLGINGAAIATFIASVGYCGAKIFVVYKKFGLQPFTQDSLIVTAILAVGFGLFFFWDFSLHPVVSIAIKASIMTLLYVLIIYKLKISTEVNEMLYKFLKIGKSRPE